jgi:hypothetical protein
MSTSWRKRSRPVAAVLVVCYVIGSIAAVRAGYRLGRNAFVRCRQGHLFTTIWIPGASLKAIRLGFWRVQWCPVGRHVDLVRLVKEADLSAPEREFAADHHDALIP